MNKDILIIMPAFNESKVISSVICDVKSEGYENILVVDDCSTDNTFKVATDCGVIVLKHPINRGAGAATATGIEYAKREGFECVVLIDSDGQHRVSDIKKLIDSLKNSDVVIGSRMIGDLTDMPVVRRIANKVGSLVTFFFFGKYVTDSQSGFKALNRRAIETIKITFDKYEFCSEIIGEIYSNNLIVSEVPIKILYSDHSLSKGHGQSIGNGFRMILRFLMRG